jgi:UDP-glucose 4-epimerase
MPTAVITGATGFLGTHLLARLVRDGWDVTAVARDTSRLGPGVRAIETDLADLDPAAFGEEVLDAVFHLAAYTPKAAGDSDADAILAANVLGLQRVLAAATRARRFIFASTLDVYAAPREGQRLDEHSSVGPASLYGASKLFGERLVEETVAGNGVEGVLLRYGHLYGPGEDAYAKFVPHTIRNLMQGRPPYLYGDGSAEIDLLYVDDAVEATVRAATLPEVRGVINVVSGTSQSLREIATTLVEIVGFLAEVRYVPDRPQKPSIRFDATRMREVLGEWPLTGLAEGLRREVMHVAHAESEG